MPFLILLLAFVSGNIPHETELKEAVTAYWTLLHAGDKAGALKYVSPESQNNFITRREPVLRNWRFLDAAQQGENQAEVRIEVEGLFQGGRGFEKLQKRETWVWDNGGWKVKVEKPAVANVAAALTAGVRKPLQPILKVSPSQLKLPFLNDPEQGTITIHNGTPMAAQVVSAKYDETRFVLLDPLGIVQPGTVTRLRLRYTGKEDEKNLKSELTLVIKQSDKETTYLIPVVYNYLSPATRGVLGLTEEQAQALKRGEKHAPALQRPKSPVKDGEPEKPPAPQP